MADRYYTAVPFTLEKNVVTLSCRVVFGASGTCVLDSINSKGFAAINPESVSFTGVTLASSSVIGTISSFAGIFSGMSITDSQSLLQASTVINSATSTLNISINKAANTTSSGTETFTASGGRYRLQFGRINSGALVADTYNKLMYVERIWDESTGSAIGTAVQTQLAPTAGNMFVVQNNTQTVTIPRTLTSSSTDASIVLQFGTGNGVNFQAANPAAGDVLRLLFVFSNSTAV